MRLPTWAMLLLLILAGVGLVFVFSAPSAADTSEFIPPSAEMGDSSGFSVLTANVGNGDPRCVPQILKLCRSDVEARLTENIASLGPDVVALQETLADHLCDRFPPTDRGSVCAAEHSEPQVRRLLGPDYTIVCESKNLIECIGVRTDVGEIVGCGLGELCESDRVAAHRPGCRRHVATFGATVQVHGEIFDIVNAHPENRSAECRVDTLQQIFEGGPTDIVQEERALILGDLNFDPWRTNDVSASYWNRFVGETEAFYYHSGTAERVPPYPTLRYPLYVNTVDHVVSNFLRGTTVTLGDAPGTTRLDGGSGTDHRALYGRLEFQE